MGRGRVEGEWRVVGSCKGGRGEKLTTYWGRGGSFGGRGTVGSCGEGGGRGEVLTHSRSPQKTSKAKKKHCEKEEGAMARTLLNKFSVFSKRAVSETQTCKITNTEEGSKYEGSGVGYPAVRVQQRECAKGDMGLGPCVIRGGLGKRRVLGKRGGGPWYEFRRLSAGEQLKKCRTHRQHRGGKKGKKKRRVVGMQRGG